MSDAFELRVQPHRDNEVKFVLLQRPARRRGQAEVEPEELVAIWGAPVYLAQEAISSVLREAGVARGVTSLRAGDIVDLSEAVGTRLAVLFFAIKPLRKLERIRKIAEEILQMTPEATCFWLGRIVNGEARDRARAKRALRILLADE